MSLSLSGHDQCFGDRYVCVESQQLDDDLIGNRPRFRRSSSGVCESPHEQECHVAARLARETFANRSVLVEGPLR